MIDYINEKNIICKFQHIMLKFRADDGMGQLYSLYFNKPHPSCHLWVKNKVSIKIN